MTTQPTPEALEQQLIELQIYLKDQAEQDAAEHQKLAVTLKELSQQLDDVEVLQKQVQYLQSQLKQLQRQVDEPRPATDPEEIPPTDLISTKPTKPATTPSVSKRRQLALGTAAFGLLMGLLLHQQLHQKRNPAAAPQTAAAGILELRADKPSWLEVRSTSGKNLFVGELLGSKRFAVGAGLEVLAGRPDLVSVRLGNAPHRPLGRIEDVDWHRFGPRASSTHERKQNNQSQDQDKNAQQ